MDYQSAEILKYLKELGGTENVTITSLNLKGIDVGNMILGREDFGVVSQYDENGDIAFVAVSKVGKPEGMVKKLEEDAIPVSAISYTKPTATDDIYGTCHPYKTGGRPVMTVNTKFIEDYGNFILVGPYIVGDGCSGSGLFAMDATGRLIKIGVGSARHKLGIQESVNFIVYSYAAMTEQDMWTNVHAAVGNITALAVSP